jgi:hypothetical protein
MREKEDKPMKQQTNKTRAEQKSLIQSRFDLSKDTLPEGAFTVGGILYPQAQFTEVLSYWFQDKPLPRSTLDTLPK